MIPGALAALLLGALLAAPVAGAATASVELTERAGAWNGRSEVALDADDPREARVWVPRDARVQNVEGASWEAAGVDALLVTAENGSARIAVAFDIPTRSPLLARVVAPQDYDSLIVRVTPPEGSVFDGFEQGSAILAPARAGDAVPIRIVSEGRVGELPLLLTVGLLSLLVLLGTIAWHRMRPPLEGREAQKFLEHLSELQARLLPPVLVFALLNLFYFGAGLRSVEIGGMPFLAPTWGVDASISARAFDAVAERLVPEGVELVVLRPADAVLAQVGMCLFLAFATVLPLLVYEIGAFIAPGLESKERGVALRVLPLVSGLFIAGALLGYLVMAPLMIATLYGYAPGIGAVPLLAVGDLVSFALLIILALAAAFELPVVMYVLARLGLVQAKTFGRYLRHAILLIVIVAGLVTPDPSVISQLLLAVPIVALYVLGIGASALGERKRAA